MKIIYKLFFIMFCMMIYDIVMAVPNCPPSNGNVDIFTRIIDYRSKPGDATIDFKKTIAAMNSGGNGKLSGICVEAHSNIPNSKESTVKEAKRFAAKICRANLTNGAPIYIYGYGNEIPSSDYWLYNNKNQKNKDIYNHRIVVRYIYSCPKGLSCISPLSGVVLDNKNRVAFGAGVCVDKVIRGATLRTEAELAANRSESAAREMMITVRELLSKGVTSAAQQREIATLQEQARKALTLSKSIRKNLKNIPHFEIKSNCIE